MVKMNSLERTLTALNFKEPDKVPIDLHNFQMCAEISGMDFDKFFRDGSKMAESQIQLWKIFKHDVIMMENGTAALAEALGCGVVYRRNESPVVQRSVLNTIDDINRLKSVSIKDCPVLLENLKATSLVCKELSDKAFIIGRGDQGPFSLASLLLGVDNFLVEIALGENEEAIHKLLDYCTDFIIEYAKAQLRSGAYCTSIGDSTAGPDVVSPAVYEKYALPYEKRIVEEIHRDGGLIALHICGNATLIIGQMLSTGADILEIDQKTNMKLAKETTYGKVTLLGQISPMVLRTGKREEISELTRCQLGETGTGGGVILGPGCALASDTPYENIFEMISVRDKFISD